MQLLETAESLQSWDVSLWVTDTNYVVTYGAEFNKFEKGITGLTDAIKDFNSCVVHQMGCDGLLEDLSEDIL